MSYYCSYVIIFKILKELSETDNCQKMPAIESIRQKSNIMLCVAAIYHTKYLFSENKMFQCVSILCPDKFTLLTTCRWMIFFKNWVFQRVLISLRILASASIQDELHHIYARQQGLLGLLLDRYKAHSPYILKNKSIARLFLHLSSTNLKIVVIHE